MEDELEKRFQKYAEKIKKINDITDKDKLFLYANYKQALFGNNNNPKPFIFDQVGIAKWNEWNSIRDATKETAMNNYIEKVKSIIKEYN
jgi:diazepam-binding inhibitor (GABA receptor modulating acyl-CoA-binding protein)